MEGLQLISISKIKLLYIIKKDLFYLNQDHIRVIINIIKKVIEVF
jgi:hypothetical protein